MLPLAGSSSPSRVTSRGGRGSPHTMHTLVQGALPDGGFMRMIEVQTSYHVVAGSPIIPIFSPLFSCHQEKSHWEWAEAADFYILLYAWVKVPRVGWEPTDDIQIVCTGESHTCGSESHRRHTTGGFLASVHHCSPSLALSGSVQVGVWIDTHRGQVETAIFLSLSLFSVFSVPPPFTSPLVLTLTLPCPSSWRLLVCVFKFLPLVHAFKRLFVLCSFVCLSNCSWKSLPTLWAWQNT